MTLTTLYRFLSLNIWGNLPSVIQRKISKSYASVYDHSITKYIIKPYCKLNYPDPAYLDQFQSASGSANYSSFQDFFTRVYVKSPTIVSNYVWPCEGLLCDHGKVGELEQINVKGDKRKVSAIFGTMGKEIPNGYYFSNIFLHNNNYHRIHAPAQSTIKEIEYIEGDLILLRPWVYKTDPSLPAMRNERVNISMIDTEDRMWYISIVGGPAVGTIELNTHIKPGYQLDVAEEIGKFLLGSTCCLLSPLPSSNKTGDKVFMADPYSLATKGNVTVNAVPLPASEE